MMSLLQPGQKGCLAPGAAYRESARITRSGLPGRPVRLQGNGASLHGGITVTANDVVVGGVRIQGLGEQRRGHRGRPRRPGGDPPQRDRRQQHRQDDAVRLRRPRRRHDHRRERDRRVRACAPRTSSSQGIFVRNSTGTTIANNVVSGTPGDGIAVAYSSRTSIVRNHVNGNSDGVYLGPSATETLVVDNLLTYPGRHNVHGGGGFANLVTGNCIWRAPAGNVAGGGFLAVGNFVGSPRYVNRPVARDACGALRAPEAGLGPNGRAEPRNAAARDASRARPLPAARVLAPRERRPSLRVPRRPRRDGDASVPSRLPCR